MDNEPSTSKAPRGRPRKCIDPEEAQRRRREAQDRKNAARRAKRAVLGANKAVLLSPIERRARRAQQVAEAKRRQRQNKEYRQREAEAMRQKRAQVKKYRQREAEAKRQKRAREEEYWQGEAPADADTNRQKRPQEAEEKALSSMSVTPVDSTSMDYSVEMCSVGTQKYAETTSTGTQTSPVQSVANIASSKENPCSIPGCSKTTVANPELNFHRPRNINTKRKWETAVFSRVAGVDKKLNILRVCSLHFADDAYLETDVLRAQLGFSKRRKRLKVDAVPTIFHEQKNRPVPQAQTWFMTASTTNGGQTADATSSTATLPAGKQASSLGYPEGALVLDGLPLQPLMPYQKVGHYGFVYTLVPYRLEPGLKKEMQHKSTQTAVPTSTLGTQTCILARSTTTQTRLTVAPSSSLSLTSSGYCLPTEPTESDVTMARHRHARLKCQV